MNIAICEDNESHALLLQKHITTYFAKQHSPCDIFVFSTGSAFLEAFGKMEFPIVFMDIFLSKSGENGMTIARHLRENKSDCKIIFTTISRDYGLASYDVNSVHYIIKPVKFEDVKIALDRCCDTYRKELQSLSILSNRKKVPVLLRNILYFEASSKRVIVHLVHGMLTTYATLEELEMQINAQNDFAFCRCHNSYLVSLSRIDRLENGDFFMENGDKILIKRKGLKAVEGTYFMYLSDQARETLI